MQKLVLLRNGQSVWNQQNRFAGWTDVDLSAEGKQQAVRAGQLLRQHRFSFDIGFTSVLKRAIKTLDSTLEELDLL
ncbi:2,3-bisphosphoglycerate-dependent phosphoglycerate mutase [Hymenobacter terrestris]|uniref:2,3-bisphosphoglycerate-dependent phosphoglycerate mutase n=1 Tax=Hymenobacter terrestris TaxID=2748310 RepID=UPI001C408F18|nr:2,3-bisphosphoglycerate-dependent phosphoglycerate mutase [Hymenobacter terrestris]